MRYRFVLSPRVRGMIEWSLEHYHENKESLEAYKNDMVPSIIQKYPQYKKGENNKENIFSGVDPSMIHGTDTGRPTEEVGMKIATSPYVLHTERCIRAVDKALEICDETDKQLIDLVYWKHSYTVIGAAQKVGLTKTPAYNRINNILCFIGLELGFINI